MTSETWQALLVSIPAVTTVILTYLSTWRHVSENGTKLDEVKRLAEPTGNSYAQHTLDSLARLERRFDLLDVRADLIADELMSYRKTQPKG